MSVIILLYPNDTKLTIEGDEVIITQILGALNMMTIEYEVKPDTLIS